MMARSYSRICPSAQATANASSPSRERAACTAHSKRSRSDGGRGARTGWGWARPGRAGVAPPPPARRAPARQGQSLGQQALRLQARHARGQRLLAEAGHHPVALEQRAILSARACRALRHRSSLRCTLLGPSRHTQGQCSGPSRRAALGTGSAYLRAKGERTVGARHGTRRLPGAHWGRAPQRGAAMAQS
jgi:hypothetical protein